MDRRIVFVTSSASVAVVAAAACGLFPDVSKLGPVDASLDDVTAAGDGVGGDVAAYADVRLHCEQRPCVPQSGETCCWFKGTADLCIDAGQTCTGVADLACYGSLQCLAVGKTACCLTLDDAGAGTATTCTDLGTCASGIVLCDRPVDASFGDPTDNGCPVPTVCKGLNNKLGGYNWRTCQ